MIVFEGVDFSYGVRQVLRQASFSVAFHERVAVLGGSGGEFIQTARDRGAQVYLTGEVRHHQVPPGLAADFAVLAVGFYAATTTSSTITCHPTIRATACAAATSAATALTSFIADALAAWMRSSASAPFLATMRLAMMSART